MPEELLHEALDLRDGEGGAEGVDEPGEVVLAAEKGQLGQMTDVIVGSADMAKAHAQPLFYLRRRSPELESEEHRVGFGARQHA